MGLPTDEPVPEGPPPVRPEIRVTEAREARERRCADCGRTTAEWKPVRRKGTAVLVCPECAAKPPAAAPANACPSCGASVTPDDVFCGKCGARRALVCPTCGTALEADDAFCGKCGAKLGS